MTKQLDKPRAPRAISPRQTDDKVGQIKLKIFTQGDVESDYVFEKQVNEFMAGIEVIEAKAEAFQGKYNIIHTISILYKD